VKDHETTLTAGSVPPTVISALPLEQTIEAYLDRDDLEGLREFLATQEAPDLADIVDRLDARRGDAVFALLPLPLAAEVLSEVGSETANRLLGLLSPDRAADLLEHLPVDDASTVLSQEESERAGELLASMEPVAADRVRSLLKYPESSAGRMMTDRFLRVGPDLTAAEVFEAVRAGAAEAEKISDVFVVDRTGFLVGVASLREVILAAPDLPIRAFMTTKVISVAPTDDQEVVARLVAHYNFMGLPVVESGKMIGLITVDDVIDVLIEEGTEDQLKFGAVEPGVVNQPYFTTPIWTVVRSRVWWLLLLFVAETATGTVLRTFEDELAAVVALSFFIPLLIGTGGNTGAQTVSTIIRGLALKEIRLRDTMRVVVRELGSGLLLGLLLGAVGFARAQLWGTEFQLSIVVALTLVAICTWANTIGALIPLVAQRFKIDPALVSAPLITTLVDATGLAIYLLIAKALLPELQ
jgi:magnesium transporter